MLLNFNDAARRLAVRTDTLDRLVSSGAVPAPRIVGEVARFVERELAEWEAAGCPRKTPPTRREALEITEAQIREDIAETERAEEIAERLAELQTERKGTR